MNTVISTTGATTTGATTPVAAISARGLRKSFGEKTVLDGIDLTVAQGTILALLGPNGAGKTTAVHLLTTYLRPDAGEIRIAGQDPAKNPQAVRRAIGVTGQFSAVDGYLTGRENLMLMADLHLLPKDAGRRRVVGQERGDREQLADVPHPPAVPRQRVRPDQLAADGDALVRRVRAVHPGERDAARTADRDEDRRQPGHHDRLVRRGSGAVVRLVAAAVRAGAEAALS